MDRADSEWNAGFWTTLTKHIARITKKPENAEDLLHAAYLRLEEYRKTATVANPAGFMVRAAANLSKDQDRHRRVRAEVDTPVYDMIDLFDDHPLQDEVLLARNRLARVRAGLAELSPRTREVFLSHRLEGRKYREIAQDLDISVSAVEKHIAKAVLFLAGWMQDW